MNAFLGTANVNPARNGSTGIGKIIDSINEINPTIFSAIDFAAFCFAFSIVQQISKDRVDPLTKLGMLVLKRKQP